MRMLTPEEREYLAAETPTEDDPYDDDDCPEEESLLSASRIEEVHYADSWTTRNTYWGTKALRIDALIRAMGVTT